MDKEQNFLRIRTLDEVYCDSQGEYVLPDYNSDIKKILFTKATPTLTGKFQDGDNLEFVGDVVYDFIYLDGENMITHTSFSTEYDLTLKLDSCEYVDSMIKTRVNALSARLLGPRKISVKCNLESTVYISEEDVIDKITEDGEEGGFESESMTVKVPNFVHKIGEEKSSDELLQSIDGVTDDEIEVLTMTVENRINTVVSEGDKIQVKGESTVGVLIKEGENTPYKVEKNFAFEDSIDCSDEEGELNFDGEILTKSVKCEVRPTENGVDVVMCGVFACEVFALSEKEVDLITDCYFTNCENYNTYEDFTYCKLVLNQTVKERYSAEIEREKVGAENIRNIIFTGCEGRIDSTTVEGSKVKVKGVLRFSSIACEVLDDNLPNYVNLKFDMPYEKELDFAPDTSGVQKAEVYIDASSPSVTLDEKNVYPSCDVKLKVLIFEKEHINRVNSTKTGDEEYKKDGSIIRVYFPKPDETLFSIGKKFHTSPMQIANDNALSEEVFRKDGEQGLKNVKKLIIK